MRLFKPVLALVAIAVSIILLSGLITLIPGNPGGLTSPLPQNVELPLPAISVLQNQAGASQPEAALNSPLQPVTQQQTAPTPTAVPTLVVQPTPSQDDPGVYEPVPNPNITTCAEIWEVREIPFNLPLALEYPRSIDELKTEYNYYYLAAMLIQNKAVDASQCPFNGLQTITTANQCGVEVARPVILEWQNMYDSKLFETGVNFGVPARLLKRIFALESQFWPGIYIDILESGFGQLNETGADALLMYNPRFFGQFCPTVLHPTTCDLGYLGVGTTGQRLLRGALVRAVDASCPTCPMGINTNRALASIPLFAEVVKANCSQVGQIIQNTTEKKPGQVADYVDLWKITMANYNAGPGCTIRAVQDAWDEDDTLITWDDVSKYFNDPECQSAPFYVSDIFK